jgi:hypothetical protein
VLFNIAYFSVARGLHHGWNGRYSRPYRKLEDP